ncbi:MAG TPA: four helix bundle protein [Clostridia bacterium]|nr:four helix bundle protein [Clostridia bacterium]
MSGLDFKKLNVWQKSKDLAVDIYKLTSCGEIARDYGFLDQIRKAAVSVSSNIAEGNDRESEKEFIRFLYIAKGSLAELRVQLEIARDIGYIDEANHSDMDAKCIEISRMLGGFIKTLRSKVDPDPRL